MNVTGIILAHYKEREANLKRIVDDLLDGTVKPERIIMFIDNQEIEFEDDRVTIIRSSKHFLPGIRFAVGLTCETDYCFFIDDDLSVQKETLANFTDYATKRPFSILGLEGSILGHTDAPYSNDLSIPRGNKLVEVDVIIRTYFVPLEMLVAGFHLRTMYPDLPRRSLDDVFLSLGNKYLNREKNYVIPVDGDTDLIELPDGGVGQSYNGEHYENKNIVCRFLMDRYEQLGR